MSMFSIKNYLPRTLFGRSLLILVTPVLLIQIITSFVFFDRHWTKVTTQLAFAVAGEIAVLTDALNDNDDIQKFERIKRLSAKHLSLSLERSPNAKLPTAQHSSIVQVWEGVVAQKLAHELSKMIDEEFVIHTNFAKKDVEVFIKLPNGVLRIDLPQRRLFSSSAYIFLLWMIGTSLLLLFVAIIFMRNQIRPIRKLAVATDRFGKGRETPFFKPEGASEVRQAGNAFLDMKRRIERQISQRTDMLAGVSHDLRTPLTRMKLQLEMLPKGQDCEDIKQDIIDMERMIDGYLDFVRGDGEEEFESVDLQILLSKLLENAQKLNSNIKVELNSIQACTVPARPLSIERALSNIVNNAARYADTIKVTVKPDGEKIELLFEDNGPGIPEDKYQDVFKPFKRIEESRNPETGGVGLGLAVAQDIIHAHGGKIMLGRSKKLGGLSLTVRIPIE